MKTKLLLLLPLLLFVFPSAKAETLIHNDNSDTTIIELFTSQGCSSCPPAERWLGKLKDDPRLWKSLFPVAFHVDYWDYIGWKDIYAQPTFSQRQRQYKNEKASASIYTPGFVVNGKEWRGWFSQKSLPATQTFGKLTATFHNNQLSAEYVPPKLTDHELKLNVAIVAIGINTKIKNGENAGRTLPQDFTVIHFQSENSSDRHWQMQLPAIAIHNDVKLALVLWASSTESQTPLQVAGDWLE
jgi:hypothetical protein